MSRITTNVENQHSENGRPKPTSDEASVAEAIDKLNEQLLELRTQLGGIIVGMDQVSEQLLIALLCRGHWILQGMPGLAKTMLVSTMSSVLDLSFRRVQFTPDLMPGDITGTEILEEDHTTGKRVFRFVEGPLFGNMILADGKLLIQDGEVGYLRVVDPSPSGYKELSMADVFGKRSEVEAQLAKQKDRKTKKIPDFKYWSPMALSNGHLIVRGQGTMKCLNLKP
jgi:hypothetical protein